MLMSRLASLMLVLCAWALVSAPPVVRADSETLNVSATDADGGQVYVGRTDTLVVTLTSSSASIVSILNVTNAGGDAARGYFQVLAQFPLNVPAHGTAQVPVLFAPNAPNPVDGARLFADSLKFNWGGNTSADCRVTGTGVVVYATCRTDTSRHEIHTRDTTILDSAIVSVQLTRWTDPLGTANIRSFTFDLTHYRPSVVRPDTDYNVAGTGQFNTLSAGGGVRVTTNDTTNGRYTFNVSNITAPWGVAGGPLLNLLFTGRRLLRDDTTQLAFNVRAFLDGGGRTAPFVIMTTTSAGSSIKVDSIHQIIPAVHEPLAAVRNLALQQNEPNPFSDATTIVFSVAEPTTARVSVYNALGQEVRLLSEGRLASGNHALPLMARDLPSGQYRVVIATPAGLVQRGMTLIR